jgi:hypothetical protein
MKISPHLKIEPELTPMSGELGPSTYYVVTVESGVAIHKENVAYFELHGTT